MTSHVELMRIIVCAQALKIACDIADVWSEVYGKRQKAKTCKHATA